MIFSMTGYGTATGNSGNLAVTVELKSVNNRFLDVSVRLPRLYSFAEEALKGLVQQRLGRGKVDVFVNIDSSKEDSVVIRLNEPVLKAYQAAFSEMKQKYLIPDDAGTLADNETESEIRSEGEADDAPPFSLPAFLYSTQNPSNMFALTMRISFVKSLNVCMEMGFPSS